MEIAHGIHRIEAPLGERFIAIYLLIGDRASLLVDTGIASSIADAVLPYMASQGIAPEKIRYVVSTHCDFDHVGGNASARAAFPKATMICHRLDLPMAEDLELLIGGRYGEFVPEHGYDDTNAESKSYIRDVSELIPVDLSAVGGERLRLGDDWQVELMHTPGHSRGSMSVWDPRSATALIGDAVLGTGLVNRDGHPAFPPTYRYVETYRATIDRLQATQIEILGTSHFPLYRQGAVQDFLAISRSYTYTAEELILSALSSHPDGLSALEMIAAIHEELGPWDSSTARALMYPVIGHLEWMSSYGAVARLPGRNPARWQLV